MTRQIVLDTETTGLSPAQGHRIIEIGCVELINRRLTGQTFHYYLQPDRKVDPGAFAVHGISDQFLKDKQRFKDIFREFQDFIKGCELIIHNAPFDVGFIEHEFRLVKETSWGKLSGHCEIIDTLVMARKKHPGQRNNLDALCKRYQVNNQHRDKHGALLDAEILAELYLTMTGGQNHLILDEAPKESVLPKKIEQIAADKHSCDLVTIKANEQECQEHATFMQFMKQQSGEVVWDQFEKNSE